MQENMKIQFLETSLKTLKFGLLILAMASVVGCTTYTDGGGKVALWECRGEQQYIIAQITFIRSRNQNAEEIWYEIIMDIENEYYKTTMTIFEINEDIKPFSEWNECNVKFPSDTTKNWLFRFEGKNIPTNISILHDLNTNVDILVFWDSVSNIKYNFKKRIMELP